MWYTKIKDVAAAAGKGALQGGASAGGLLSLPFKAAKTGIDTTKKTKQAFNAYDQRAGIPASPRFRKMSAPVAPAAPQSRFRKMQMTPKAPSTPVRPAKGSAPAQPAAPKPMMPKPPKPPIK